MELGCKCMENLRGIHVHCGRIDAEIYYHLDWNLCRRTFVLQFILDSIVVFIMVFVGGIWLFL